MYTQRVKIPKKLADYLWGKLSTTKYVSWKKYGIYAFVQING